MNGPGSEDNSIQFDHFDRQFDDIDEAPKQQQEILIPSGAAVGQVLQGLDQGMVTVAGHQPETENEILALRQAVLEFRDELL